ncbi:two-component system sensor histidine kinase YesM [Paenibacillus forsythiae]|uniref:Two-component system sensor histidine kinase YesM n=2 Tax=Paenibacillus forsythiae TaxID=365616 RepID=A0ABU3H597_9BACL|nr:sensor histidine kinase [Paenibacillus forsythiae]MDT3425992.1 two-component system sensor histidine kinase YesM [Paenibacillus forsythiae]
MRDGIAGWFGRLPIRRKIILIFVPVIIFPLLALGLLSGEMFSRSVIEKTKNNVRDESRLILSQMDSIVKNTESSANIMTTDINRLYDERADSAEAMEEDRFHNLMESRLSIDLVLFPDADSAIFVDVTGKVYSSYPPQESRDEKVLRSGLLEKVKGMGSYGVSRWLPVERRDYIVSDPAVPVLTLGKIVFDLDSGNPLGTLFVNVRETTFASILRVMGENSSSKQYYIVDGAGRIVSSPNEQLLLKPFSANVSPGLLERKTPVSDIVGSGGGSRLATVIAYDRLNWRLVNIVSLQTLNGDIRRNFALTFAFGALCLLLSLLLAGKLSKIIVSPLLQVTKAMRKVKEGDLNIASPVTTQDETGLIATVFNSMVRQIKELLEAITEEQGRKREYELALIHAQIRPHFLYNTLDTIYVLNDLGLNEEARDTTKALADFYRVVLSKGNELIPLSGEIGNVRDYLNIMQVRNPDVLRYEIEILEELEGVLVPKLSLQPLVENAIYHGLKTKGSQGVIVIRARREGGDAAISVEDNGVGMSPEQVLRVTQFASGSIRPASIGIYSVHERIKLYFGEPYGLTVRSRPGEGTIMEIKVPGEGMEGNV